MGARPILPLLLAVGALTSVTDSWWVGVGCPFLPGLNVCAVMSAFGLPYLTCEFSFLKRQHKTCLAFGVFGGC